MFWLKLTQGDLNRSAKAFADKAKKENDIIVELLSDCTMYFEIGAFFYVAVGIRDINKNRKYDADTEEIDFWLDEFKEKDILTTGDVLALLDEESSAPSNSKNK